MVCDARLINDFHAYGLYGITYLDKKNGAEFIYNLNQLGKLLGEGLNALKALENMGLHDSAKSKSIEELSKEHNIPKEQISRFDDRILSLDSIKLKNTAEDSAYWIEETLKSYEIVSILGI